LPDNIAPQIKKEMEKHQVISLSFFDKFLLYFSLKLPFSGFFCGCCWRKYDKLMKMYEKAEEKIEHEHNIVKITNSLRDL
jgi:hypothetical protein